MKAEHTSASAAQTSSPMAGPGPLVSADALSDWVRRLLASRGVPSGPAAVIADCLIKADMKGVSSHGVSRLSIYLRRLAGGVVKADASPRVLKDTEAMQLLDADGGFGHPVGRLAMERAIEKAQRVGIAGVGVCNSTHFGMAGYYAEIAALQRVIGVVTTNSSPRMAPWGGRRAVFGTNPLAIAIPGPEAPIVLDMATSVAALGRITVAASAGSAIPSDWAFDPDGRPTTDPEAALLGTLAPVGGPKGSGLAFMLDVLAGVLSGGTFGRGVRSLYRDLTVPEQCGHFMVTIDIGAFCGVEQFKRAITEYVGEIRASGSAAEGQEVFLPGEIEQRLERRAQELGIPLSQPTVDGLRDLAEESGVPLPELLMATNGQPARTVH